MDDEQTKLWNGPSGRAWVEAQDLLDAMFEPFEKVLVEAVVARNGKRVLDVGCGTGSVALAIARTGARTTGVDISRPMLDFARSRAGDAATFIEADAQTHRFEAASFDTFVSRFGVMFFDDPVRAFSNLRGAATADAQMRFVVWRGSDDNPFMTTAERAAAPLLELPARRPGPGQFAFGDPAHVRKILEESGWRGIDLEPLDLTCHFPETALADYLTRLGPFGHAIRDVEEPTRSQIIETVGKAFDPYIHGSDVQYTAACWMISAHA